MNASGRNYIPDSSKTSGFQNNFSTVCHTHAHLLADIYIHIIQSISGKDKLLIEPFPARSIDCKNWTHYPTPWFNYTKLVVPCTDITPEN